MFLVLRAGKVIRNVTEYENMMNDMMNKYDTNNIIPNDKCLPKSLTLLI